MRALVDEGNALAAKTGMSAGAHYETEHYLEGSFKVATNAAVGNPYASEDDIEKTGWRDIVTSGASTDFSEKSFDDALTNIGQGWKDAGHDVMTSHTLGPLGPLGPNPADLDGAFGIPDGQQDTQQDGNG
ncbi:hypothetical protein [Streptomyces sp. NRRL F-5126]|uniref:hypothetical protein n=1 Tax=Streptomyces sp. NRRL F-5126 TaxID=1463857 RepID=UPI00068F9A7C|nr:hypothetical protein [Streptomyces sp. NRRL F-5126]